MRERLGSGLNGVGSGSERSWCSISSSPRRLAESVSSAFATPRCRRFLVVEGVYSDTGDLAPLPEVVSLAHALFSEALSTLELWSMRCGRRVQLPIHEDNQADIKIYR